ncbi:ral guanine nucleotide dissociation stimulator-like 1 isoform X2 [Betta splendens]|uniref:Ral guanine nucleotide dissociation stimulator-like 1 isoform X2 n=1 Tax=Betta splendens TaxID=158456 RepID=A0A6P7N884_BETSP|nr:ral guanine nucleotide dissociation stimulator-like 1 isoform X2 [Betta splendens]
MKERHRQNPVQEWGEEVEDGAVYGVTLRREPVASDPNAGVTDQCCAFVQYRTCKVRRLKAATLDLLVNHLLDPSSSEQDYSRIFLSTYRTFTCTSALIELLFHRDGAVSDLDNSGFCSSPLLTFVQTWLDEFSEDLRDPPQHPALRLLLDHLSISAAVHGHVCSQPNYCSLAGRAEELLRSFQTEAERIPGSGSADLEPHADGSADEDSGCESSDQSGLMDFSACAVAEQLTRTDAALFVRVVPYQCLGCVWSQRDKKENMSSTIRATVAQFNAVTNRVIASLLCQPADPGPAQRARLIEKWVRVAQECRRLKNFSSLRAILSALQSNAVYRMRKTWASVSRDSLATFDHLCETFPDENCVLTERELLLESPSGGPVPYLGTYLTVLTMLDTALPDAVQGGLINFEKRRREFEVLSQIRVLQASCSRYSLAHRPRVAAWLQGQALLTDQESYELSKQLEPPVDSCSPSGWKHRSLTKKLSSLLTAGDGAKKVPADQISVSSSGSSGSEMEDVPLSSACSIRPQSFHSSCSNVSSCASSSSSDSPLDPCSPAWSCGGARPKPVPASHHKRSVSMTALPVYNRQVADSCVVRVNVDLGHNNGNMYKSIVLTSQDKAAQVIQRSLEKHHLEHMQWEEFSLAQVISPDRELLIPEKANVFYAMSTAANFDFVLRHKKLRAASSPGRRSTQQL